MKLKSNISQKYINKFNLALKLQNRSEFIQAIKIYKNLMELNTSIKGIEFNLSLCYFATENYLESAKLFHQLHTEDPDNTIFLNHCAVAYLKQIMVSSIHDPLQYVRLDFTGRIIFLYVIPTILVDWQLRRNERVLKNWGWIINIILAVLIWFCISKNSSFIYFQF